MTFHRNIQGVKEEAVMELDVRDQNLEDGQRDILPSGAPGGRASRGGGR